MAPLLWLAVAVTAASASCPTEEWKLNDGNCYWVSPFDVEWLSGDLACHTEFRGARMVSIHDNLESAFVFERVGAAWLGFRRYDTDSDWYWTDGSPANWTNWCDGQPAGDGQRFAYTPSGGNGCWATSDLNGYTHVVCKVPEQD